MQENVFSEKLWKAKVRDILETYQKKMVTAIKNGYDGMEENKWTFAGAFLYSLTVITTIGESVSPPPSLSLYLSLLCTAVSADSSKDLRSMSGLL